MLAAVLSTRVLEERLRPLDQPRLHPHTFNFSIFIFFLTRLYEKLLKVAWKGHHKAMEKVAYAMLFGDYMTQNIPKAKELFEKLALEGSPKAQMVMEHSYLNFMHPG